MKISLLTTACTVFHLYLIYAYIKLGVQKSISKSYTELEWKPVFKKIPFIKERHLFQAMILTVSVCIALAGNTLMFYVAGVLLTLVGFLPTIKNPKHLIPHIMGAIGAIMCGYYSIVIDLGEVLPLIIFVGCVIVCFFMFYEEWIWYVEIAAFEIIFITLILI